MSRRIAIPPTFGPSAFAGWLKLAGGPWQLKCHAGTREACERQLLTVEVPRSARLVRRVVLPAGQLPVRRPAVGRS
jgi:hypothetical protein